MPRTIQKKIKFTKGMITPSLLERTDLPMYDSSAQEIYNYICTPYGGFRTRRGTRKISELDLAEKLYFSSASQGTFEDNDFASGSLESLNDGDVITVLDIGSSNVKSEANIYLSNIRLDYSLPSLTATFTETGVQYQAELTGVSIVDGGLGFDGTLSVSGTVLSGATTITPTIDSLGTITSVSFESATYKYLPTTPQAVHVSANPPECVIGFSVSADNTNWSVEQKYTVSNVAIPEIKLKVKNCRYLRIKYYGSGIKTQLKFDNLYAKYEFYKLVPFVYNINQKNMIVLSEKKILIFKDDTLEKTINITSGLEFKNIRAVKYAQNEDVIVFTEEGVAPRELRRTTNDWTFQTFPLKNIPFHNFSGETETAKTVGITPSELQGALTIEADSSVFDANSVGQEIDGNGGRFKITEYVSGTKVLGYTIIPFLNTDKITSWTYITGWERCWSSIRGWPISCLFYQQRLWFGGSAQRPSTIWASRTGIYNDFNNAGNYDNDSINQDLNTENQIVNLLSNRGLQIFTSGDEWTAAEGSLTPNDFTVVKNTSNGSDIGLTPKNLGGVTLFIEKNGKSLLSYVYDYNQAAYKTSNIGILSALINEPVDMEIDDNSSLDEGDYLYVVMKDGRMLVTSINFEQEINATSIFDMVGDIQSVSNLINETYIIVTINDKTYLEVIDDDTNTDLTIEKYVSQTITGLSDYEGEYVHVYAGDDDYGKYLVEDGTVTLRNEVNAVCKIGFAFSSRLESNDVAINGRSTSTHKRISKAVVTTNNTTKISLNGIEKTSDNDIFDFFAVSSYGKRVRFVIESEFNKIEVLSVLLQINYGVG